MERKYLLNIELNRILDMASELAACPESKDRIKIELPDTDTSEVRFKLMQTDLLASHMIRNGNPRISACEGAQLAVSRAVKGGVLSMGELLAIYGALRNFSRLHSWFENREDNTPTVLDDYFFSITPQPGLERAIPDAIISETEMADTASGELLQLRRKIRAAENSIRDKLDAVVKNPNTSKYLQDAIVSIRNGRYVVPVKAEHRGDIGGVIHDVSSSGGTVFVEPAAVVEANAKILQLKSQEQAEIERILADFTAQVSNIAPLFDASYSTMIELDIRIAKAELGLSMKGVMPSVNENQSFSLVKAKHPLLDSAKVVAVDIKLGEDFDTMVITGPNTGGKTVTLKTAGLLCAMAQLGYLIPAHDSSSICVFEKILVDIGDEQSIEQSLSTFSGHIKNITDIFKQVNSRSLVLLDELGAGTDPAEGAALAVSVIEKLRESGARIMATTHYAELKMFALDTPGVQNAGCEFDVETLRPTYKLLVGIPGRSNAFFIGEKLGIPSDVIEKAKSHLSAEQKRFETVLGQLEDARIELRNQHEEIENLKGAADKQLEAARQKRDALIKQGEDELNAARRKAKALADEVQENAYELMDEIKRIEKDQRLSNTQKAQRAREIVRKDSEQLAKKASQGEVASVKTYTPLAEVEQGQEVWVPEMEKAAVVVSAMDKSGMVEIRLGALKTKISISKLAEKQKPQPQKTSRYQRKETSAPSSGVGERHSGLEINLLGKTVDEALMETDSFIDSALMSGLSTIYIIHGRGTGALRSAIQKHLRGHKSVKKYRLGQYGEGEDGVTVVELK